MHFGHAANSALYPNLRYDPVTDFEHIGMFAQSPMAIVAKKDFPAKDFKEFVAYLGPTSPRSCTATPGSARRRTCAALSFLQAIDLKVTTVPYKGTAPALNDLIGGQFDFMCDQTVNIAQPVKSGLIKGYAVPTKTRLAVLPDLPTTAEMGMPNVTMDVWYGMWAPKGTPKPVVDKLSAALRDALKDPEVKGRLTSMGAEISGDDPSPPTRCARRSPERSCAGKKPSPRPASSPPNRHFTNRSLNQGQQHHGQVHLGSRSHPHPER